MQEWASDKWIEAWRHLGVMASGGWNGAVVDFEAAASPATKTHLYVFDHHTSWTWLASVMHAGFREVAEDGRKADEADRLGARGVLAELIKSLADSGKVPDGDAEYRLSILAALYAGGTKTYAAAQGFPDGAHFVILVYRGAAGSGVMLRPFAMDAPPDRPVDLATFAEVVGQVMQIDGANHPEWLEGKG